MTYNKDIGKKWKYVEYKTRTIEQTDTIVDSIIDQFVSRARMGKEKYNTDLDREDLNLVEWLDHAIEEHMDAILYLQKIRKTLGGKKG
jgi:hypothetical protein